MHFDREEHLPEMKEFLYVGMLGVGEAKGGQCREGKANNPGLPQCGIWG